MNVVVILPEDLKTLLSETVRAELSNLNAPSEPFSDFPDLLNRAQTARLLNVSLATLDNWTKEGRLRKHRIGAAVRFRKDEVLAAFSSLEKFQRIPNR